MTAKDKKRAAELMDEFWGGEFCPRSPKESSIRKYEEGKRAIKKLKAKSSK